MNAVSESIKDYRVYNLLGTGGFADVYRALCHTPDREEKEVAIKMIDKKKMKKACMSDRVRKEVEIHSRLKHPSVLQLYNYFEDSNYVYLVLELCHNGEMHRYLQSRAQPFAEDEARRFMRQIVDGILYLHSHGILHRDLSLSNLLLTKDMNVKIADFGLATQLQGPEEKHFTMCGTPNYISPEIAMRSAHGLESDVWSLGCMLYTFLVGHPPFDTDAVKSTLNRVISAEYHLPKNISPEARDLIQALLCKNPKDRIPLREILTHKFMLNKPSMKKVMKMPEMSMDSGRGTITSTKYSHSSNGHNKPMPAFHHKSEIAEDNEHYSHQHFGSDGRGSAWTSISQGSSIISRHPASPPVRERDSQSEEELRKTKHAMRPGVYNYNLQQTSQQLSNLMFTDTTDRSCGGQPPPSLKPDAPPRPYRPHHNPGSVSSSQSTSDFSLNATRKVLNFESESVSSSSHEILQYTYKDPANMQTQDLMQKVQNYLGQQCDNVSSLRENQKMKKSPVFMHDDVPVQFSSPEPGPRRNQLTEQEVRYCNRGHRAATSERTEEKGKGEKGKGGSNDALDTENDILEPFNTERLRPVRQRMKNAVVHIQENGDVCMEFLRREGQDDRVLDVILITKDGRKMKVYVPPKTQFVSVSEQPVPVPDKCKTFEFPNIPVKYLKKYQYAARFVAIAKAGTPKVTLYTHRAKCMLMENTNFCAEFYDGTKFSSGKKGVKIIEKDGTSLTLESAVDNARLSSETRNILEYVNQCRHQCVQLEQVITAVQSSCPGANELFPVLVGRRPEYRCISNSGSNGDLTRNDGCVSPNIPNLQMTTFDGTLLSTTANQTFEKTIGNKAPSSATSSSSSNSGLGQKTKQLPTPSVNQIFVADVGWASSTANGEVWVRFQDGTQMNVKSSETYVVYIDAAGKVYKYQHSDPLPDFVKQKLSKLPFVLEKLHRKSPQMVSTSTSLV
ncbi:unnamed protein product [Lymnaea stagnalis]|uniref:Serine/threonine-protein kinase PLK4 n=1 Tax=Lymnaea stagnalis TaxID=6523 RepID=A0AAV2HEL1_LYMST